MREQKIRGNVQKSLVKFPLKNCRAGRYHFFWHFLKAKNNDYKKIISCFFTLFRLWKIMEKFGHGNQHYFSPLIPSSWDEKNLATLRSFIMPSQRHILALLCALKSEKKCNSQMKSRKPNLFASIQRPQKSTLFLRIFSQMEWPKIRTRWSHTSELRRFCHILGIWKLQSNDVNNPFIALFLHFDPLVYYALTCP